MTADVRALLFDATGTLVELREPLGETYARTARAHGAPISAWRLADAFARVWRNAPPPVFPGVAAEDAGAQERAWWRDVVRQTFLAADSARRPDDLEACFTELFEHFARAEAWRARPGAAAALRGLRGDGRATAVVSNFDRRLRGILEGLGLAPLLDAVVLPSDAGAAKPDAAIFALALERLGVAASEALFVGDDAQRDLAGARAAGLRAVAVGTLATLGDLPARLREGRLEPSLPSEEPAPRP